MSLFVAFIIGVVVLVGAAAIDSYRERKYQNWLKRQDDGGE